MKQNGKLVLESNTTEGQEGDRFVQVSPTRIFKPVEGEEQYFGCQPWHHIAVIAEQYGLVYVWDTREIQSICVLLPDDWNKLHHPVDNAKDLVLKAGTSNDIVSVIEALQSKLTETDLFDEFHKRRCQINSTCQDMLYQIGQDDLDNAMRMAQVKAVDFFKKGWGEQFSIEELISSAQMGVCEAMLRFNPTKGTIKHTKFTSYAFFWIRKYLQEYVTQHKTILSGTMGEKYEGLVPGTQSIDALNDKENDGPGQDHMSFMTSNVDIFEDFVEQEQRTQRKILFKQMIAELEPNEMLAYCLRYGIDTVTGLPMRDREIAKAMGIKVADAKALADKADERMHGELREKYAAKFAQIEAN